MSLYFCNKKYFVAYWAKKLLYQRLLVKMLARCRWKVEKYILWVLDILGVLKTDALGSSSLSMCFIETIGTIDVTAAGFVFSNLSLLTHVS